MGLLFDIDVFAAESWSGTLGPLYPDRSVPDDQIQHAQYCACSESPEDVNEELLLARSDDVCDLLDLHPMLALALGNDLSAFSHVSKETTLLLRQRLHRSELSPSPGI